jgi:hypothetical protein
MNPPLAFGLDWYRSIERVAYALEEVRDGYVFPSKAVGFNDSYDGLCPLLGTRANAGNGTYIASIYYDPEPIEVREDKKKRISRTGFHRPCGGLMPVSHGAAVFCHFPRYLR